MSSEPEVFVEVNDVWYPVKQVARRLAETENFPALLDLDEITMAGILTQLGFKTTLPDLGPTTLS